MKKIAKISLVAAIAVAGFTTANAQPLEEAIKNVDVSGSVVYRYNDVQDDINNSSSTDKSDNNYKVGFNLSSKVNDDVKFNARFLVATNDTFTDGNFTPLSTSAAGDANVNTTLSNANFAYTGLKNTSVTVGKQGLATPYTVATQIDDNEQTGTGALVLSTVGPVTLGGAYFNQTNLGSSGDLKKVLNNAISTKTTQALREADTGATGELDVVALAAIATLGPVTADAWYLDLQDTFNTYTLGAKSEFKLGEVTLGADARYASLKFDGADTKNTIAKLALTAKAGIVNGKVAYAATGKDGGITALDSDATTALKGWYLNSLNKTDGDYWQAVAGVDILSNLNLSANYGNLQYAGNVEEEEVYGQLTYKMSKNLSTYVRYGTYTQDTGSTSNIDATAGRLQVAYTF